MGEIVFSIFIGCCLVFIGTLMNIRLYREEKKLFDEKLPKHDESKMS